MYSGKKRRLVSYLLALLIVSAYSLTFVAADLVNGQSAEAKNVILIGWDGVQRNHLLDMLNRGLLPNLTNLTSQGTMLNITVTDHGTDTKAGWTQILTGYRWWKTGVFNNNYWFNSIPPGYTIPERVETYFGRSQVDTAFVVGKLAHMEIQDGTGSTVNGTYTKQAIYRNLPSGIDVCTNGDRNASVVGQAAIQFLNNHAGRRFFAFLHFSDPDTAGHNPNGGENSAMYEQAIGGCDFWLGQILTRLNALNIAQKTLVYVTVDHGFDEGGFQHLYAPYITLTTNDLSVIRGGDQVDVAPTIYYGLGMWGNNFSPELDGYPLQVSLPSVVEQERHSVFDDNMTPPKPTVTVPLNGSIVEGTVNITFNASDPHLSAVELLIDNASKAVGPWTWHTNITVEASGSYTWDTASVISGPHTITVLAFDLHGALNRPSSTKVTVFTKTTPTPTTRPTPTPQPQGTSTIESSPTPEIATTSPTSEPNASTPTPTPQPSLQPAPLATFSPSPTPPPLTNPSPSIPEFQALTVLPLAGAIVVSVLVYVKKRNIA